MLSVISKLAQAAPNQQQQTGLPWDQMMREFKDPKYNPQWAQYGDAAEHQQLQNLIASAKQKVMAMFNTMRPQFDQYMQWERVNKSILIQFVRSEKLPGAIKDGGPNSPVQTGPLDQGGFSSITVPSGLYRALQWRQIVKNTESFAADLSKNNTWSGLSSNIYRHYSMLRVLMQSQW